MYKHTDITQKLRHRCNILMWHTALARPSIESIPMHTIVRHIAQSVVELHPRLRNDWLERLLLRNRGNLSLQLCHSSATRTANGKHCSEATIDVAWECMRECCRTLKCSASIVQSATVRTTAVRIPSIVWPMAADVHRGSSACVPTRKMAVFSCCCSLSSLI
jgi:hypothetical protein